MMKSTIMDTRGEMMDMYVVKSQVKGGVIIEHCLPLPEADAVAKMKFLKNRVPDRGRFWIEKVNV